MSSFFQRLNPKHRMWGAVGGVIIAGSVFKVNLSFVFPLGASPICTNSSLGCTDVYSTSTHSQVTYFKFCRDILVEQSRRTHSDATEHYREAREFAKWSAKDREDKRASLPPLTPEQEQQMKAYVRMMQEHHAYNPDSEQ